MNSLLPRPRSCSEKLVFNFFLPHRYDSISTFIYNCRTGTDRCRVVNKYNDIDCPVDEPSRKALLKEGIDPVSRVVYWYTL